MARSAKMPMPLSAAVALLVFASILVVPTLDGLWVLGQQAVVHAFGQRAEGRIVGTSSYAQFGKAGRYTVTVHSYEFRDAAGRVYVHQTGQKPFWFKKEIREPPRPPLVPGREPPVSVLYLGDPVSLSWAVEYEQSWSEGLFLVGLLLLLLLFFGGLVYRALRSEDGPKKGK